MAEDIEAIIESLALDDVVLESCTVARGPGNDDNIGKVTTEFSVTIDTEDAPKVTCLVSIRTTLLDSSEEVIATVELTHRAAYFGPEGVEWEIALSSEVGRTAVSHVAPFAREMLADLTSKMDLPRYLLPLVRASNLRVSEATMHEEESPTG